MGLSPRWGLSPSALTPAKAPDKPVFSWDWPRGWWQVLLWTGPPVPPVGTYNRADPLVQHKHPTVLKKMMMDICPVTLRKRQETGSW